MMLWFSKLLMKSENMNCFLSQRLGHHVGAEFQNFCAFEWLWFLNLKIVLMILQAFIIDFLQGKWNNIPLSNSVLTL